jgi:hypothetical protein
MEVSGQLHIPVALPQPSVFFFLEVGWAPDLVLMAVEKTSILASAENRTPILLPPQPVTSHYFDGAILAP